MAEPSARFASPSADELETLRRISARRHFHGELDRIYNLHIRKTGGTSVRKREIDAPFDADTLARLRERLRPECKLLETPRKATEER